MSTQRTLGRLAGFSCILCGCVAAPMSHVPVPTLPGAVRFPVERQVSATMGEIGTKATVSLIEARTGNTLATALTDANGSFVLSFDRSFRPGAGPYFLEAVKGLSVGGAPNRAGAPLARIRTLASFQNGWTTLTGAGVTISSSTTTISALSSLNRLSDAENLALINSVAVGQAVTAAGITMGDTYNPPGSLAATTSVAMSRDAVHRGWLLVNQALLADADPIGSLMLRPDGTPSSTSSLSTDGFGSQEGLAWGTDGWALDPTGVSGAVGATVTLAGLGLPRSTGPISIKTGNGLACTVTAASTDGTWVRFTVPAGAATGPLAVTYGPWANHAVILTVL